MTIRREYRERINFLKLKNFVAARDILESTPTGPENDTLKVIETRTGKGLAAKQEIKTGQIIFCAQGEELEMDSADEGEYFTEGELKGWRSLDKNPDATYPNAICIGKKGYGSNETNLWLNPDSNNPLRLLNHNCEPNAGRLGPFTFVAMRNIQPGDEITTDYSILEVNPRWQLRCNCGSKHCRGTVGSIHSLPLALAEKYWKYIPAFMHRIYIDHARQIYNLPDEIERIAALEKQKSGL